MSCSTTPYNESRSMSTLQERRWWSQFELRPLPKLGLKNVKAITKLTFVGQEPRDYWAERGYSNYDGI
jgi:hypothetical protein